MQWNRRNAFPEEERYEHDDRGQGTGHDRHRDFVGSANGSLFRRHSGVAEDEETFEDHDRIIDQHHVGSRLFEHEDHDAWVTVDPRELHDAFMAVLHGRNVADADGGIARLANHLIADLIEVDELAFATSQPVEVSFLKAACGTIDIPARQCGDDFVESQLQ